MSVQLAPKYLEDISRYGIGIALGDVGIVRFSPPQAAVQAVVTTYRYTTATLAAFGSFVRDLIVVRKVQEDMSGPVGIAVMTGQVAKQGVVPLLHFAAILSINLAVINFLPIPALDGGRVFFLVVERVRRRAIAHKLETRIHQVAFVALIALILLITVRDLGRYGGLIVGGLKGMVGI